MAATQYSATAICVCGKPLKVFASSGRTAYACSVACTRAIARAQRGQPRRVIAPPTCLDCGASVCCGAKRCKVCNAAYMLLKSPNRFTCEHCGTTALRRKGGANKKKRYSSRWCSMRCKVDAAAQARTTRAPIEPLPPFTRIHFRSCDECGRGFVATHAARALCSDECRKARAYESVKLHPKWCASCGKHFEARRSALYCSPQCSRKAFRKIHGHDRGKYRKRAKRAGVAYVPVSVVRVFERDGWRCQICGKKTPKSRRGTNYPNAPELDHRIPLSRGGPHRYDNVQCSCRACNGAKGASAVRGQLPMFQHVGGGG